MKFNWHNLPTPRPRLWLSSALTRWRVRRNDPGRYTANLMAKESLLAAVVYNLGTANNNMFASRMGATATDLGWLASLPQFIALLILIPGTLLLGRIRSSRRPVERTALLAGVVYSLAALTPFIPENWRIFYFIAIIALANAPVQLYNATWQNYFTDAVAMRDRNEVYTSRTSLTFIAGIVVIQISGLLLGWAGDRPLRVVLYQVFFVLALVAAIVQWQTLRRLPEAESPSSGQRLSDVTASLRFIFSDARARAFTLIALIFHAGWYMGWQQFFILQSRFMGANESWLAAITVSATLMQWLMVKPWGRFVRRRGIRLSLVIGCIGLVVSPLMALVAAALPAAIQLPGMLILNLVNAFTFPAFQLSFFQATLEALPEKRRNLNISIFNSLMLAVSTVMQLLGTVVFAALGSDLRAIVLSLLITTAIRTLGTALFAAYWWRLRDEEDAGMLD